MKFWGITSSTNRRGDQENTSNENLYQECTHVSRDPCSPHFRKGLQQEPLWLREREAANGKCLSADNSDMGLWLGALLDKCQLDFSSGLNQLPVITHRILRKAWQVLKGNNFSFYFWTLGKCTQVLHLKTSYEYFFSIVNDLWWPFAFQNKSFSLCFYTQPFQKNFCPVISSREM